MTLVPVKRAFCALVLAFSLQGALSACVAASPVEDDHRAPRVEAPDRSFQQVLDRLGVPYVVPEWGKAILVNIPGFELIAFEDGLPVFRSRVIVGSTAHKTPRLETYVSTVRFRPTWRPTPSMIASGEYRDYVRPAGRRNPLGLLAVRLEPGLLVYLHDTNRRQLFEKDYRALSHGCVRVQRWADLAAWVLDMPLEEVERIAEGRRTVDVPAPAIPVTLGYFTVFPDEEGRPAIHKDVYGLGPAVPPPAGGAADPVGCGPDAAVE